MTLGKRLYNTTKMRSKNTKKNNHMLVFNYVQSDMAFLPVVAPDSFIEVATLRAMKIPTG